MSFQVGASQQPPHLRGLCHHKVYLFEWPCGHLELCLPEPGDCSLPNDVNPAHHILDVQETLEPDGPCPICNSATPLSGVSASVIPASTPLGARTMTPQAQQQQEAMMADLVASGRVESDTPAASGRIFPAPQPQTRHQFERTQPMLQHPLAPPPQSPYQSRAPAQAPAGVMAAHGAAQRRFPQAYNQPIGDSPAFQPSPLAQSTLAAPAVAAQPRLPGPATASTPQQSEPAIQRPQLSPNPVAPIPHRPLRADLAFRNEFVPGAVSWEAGRLSRREGAIRRQQWQLAQGIQVGAGRARGRAWSGEDWVREGDRG